MSQFTAQELANIYDQIFAELNSEQAQKKYRYLLIDLLGEVSELNDLYIEALQQDVPSEHLQVIKRPEIAHDPSRCPLLICLAEPGEITNEKLLLSSVIQLEEDFLTSKYYVCGWLYGSAPPDEMAEQLLDTGKALGQQLQINFVPFYEPFRTEVLQTIHNGVADQIARFMIPGVDYYYFNSLKQLKSLSANQVVTTPNKKESLFTRSDKLFFQNSLRLLFLLYVEWIKIAPSRNRSITEETLPQMMRYLLLAHNNGLSNNSDKRAFTLYSMLYGDLRRSEPLSLAIDHAIANPDTLESQFRTLGKEFKALSALPVAE